MLNKTIADKLVRIASDQLTKGLDAKRQRMDQVRVYIDSYNNQTEVSADNVFNIPFPFLSGYIDQVQSKIDNPPRVTFKVPNKQSLSEKIEAAWEMEKTSMRAAWDRKDRAEKKIALFFGRGISKVYASSIKGEYQSHYDVVDPFNFVADPTRGNLADSNYHGEVNIFKSFVSLKEGAKMGWYNAEQVALLQTAASKTENDKEEQVRDNEYDRMRSTGVDPEQTSFMGQKGAMLAQWVMRYNDEWYFLLFDPSLKVWVRAEKLEDVFDNGKTPYVSWATHYDEYSFWSKSYADDGYPITEGMRFLLNNTLENEKRRVRPQRLVDPGSVDDINDLMEYIPDGLIIGKPGRPPVVQALPTPESRTTLDIVQYLDNTLSTKTGVLEPGIDEKDAKVGIFYGQLQQEADRLGIVNKAYSESYAEKGYRFFWGLKQHLSKPKQIEMLGKGGVRLQQLDATELKDVDDVDDVIVSGGSASDELSAIEAERRATAIKELAQQYPEQMNASWVIRTRLRDADVSQDDIESAIEKGDIKDRDTLEEADTMIQAILLDEPTRLNQNANLVFIERLLDYAKTLDYVKVNAKGEEKGVDKTMKKQHDRLLDMVQAHQPIVIRNQQSQLRKMTAMQAVDQAIPQEGEPEQGAVGAGGAPGIAELRAGVARPFETPGATPEGTASASQIVTGEMTPQLPS